MLWKIEVKNIDKAITEEAGIAKHKLILHEDTCPRARMRWDFGYVVEIFANHTTPSGTLLRMVVHELAHIKNWDYPIRTASALLVILLTVFKWWMMFPALAFYIAVVYIQEARADLIANKFLKAFESKSEYGNDSNGGSGA